MSPRSRPSATPSTSWRSAPEPMTEVVVTGIGAITPLGLGAATLYERWAAGVCGIENGEGRCREFVATDHLSVKEARRADRFTQLALVASIEALADAGWGAELPYEASRIGSMIGTGIGGIGTIETNKPPIFEHRAKNPATPAGPPMIGEAAP